MTKCSLNGEWKVSFIHPETNEKYVIPAMVPGNIELDLERAGLISDPLAPDDEHPCRWVEFADWDFEREFDYNGLPDGMEKAMLNFEGIDTVADIFLNGEKLMYCENMHITHSADVTEKLKTGKNKLLVRIYAPEFAARKYGVHAPFQYAPRLSNSYLRKARHMWGWDNAPRRLSAGIWRNVTLEFVPPIRFNSVYVFTDWVYKEEDKAELICHYSFSTPDRDLSDYRIRCRMIHKGECHLDKEFAVIYTEGMLHSGALMLEHPALWNPIGFGDPNLYDFELTLTKAGKTVTQDTQRIGIRTIRLERTEVTTPEGDGEFQFYCNGEKIYMRGTNWKPVSPYHSQTPALTEKALQLALECNCNMVRVWGGGIYEDHDFFDFCDEHGLLVWQDFMFACEFPPQEDFFKKTVYEEAKFIIEKYRNHPSLAVWCGDNEDDMPFFWGAKLPRGIKPGDNKITREVLPLAISNFDPSRDFIPSSPYIADEAVIRHFALQGQNDVDCFAPEQHIYCGGKLPDGGFREFMRGSAAHFSSEIGPIGSNAMSETPEIYERELPRLLRLWNVDPETVPMENDFMTHQADRYCAVWCKSVQEVTGKMFNRQFTPEKPEELMKAINFYVGDLFKFAIESWRIQKFRRTGILWWSLLDMWPMAFNYSMVDSGFRRKYPFEVIRLSQQPVALMGEEPLCNQFPKLHVVNDTAYEQKGSYKVLAEDGRELFNGTFCVEANGRKKLTELPLAGGEACFLEWECREYSGRNYFLNPAEPYDFDRCCALAEKIRKL
ncbi:MAG: hypothetical protein IJZ19_03260 [Lentisphaeria bacterium]|nr:hypothetical protein [Lentisphaeria bacterium]